MMDRKIEIPLVSTFVPPHFSFFDYFNKFFFVSSSHLIFTIGSLGIYRKKVFSSLNFNPVIIL